MSLSWMMISVNSASIAIKYSLSPARIRMNVASFSLSMVRTWCRHSETNRVPCSANCAVKAISAIVDRMGMPSADKITTPWTPTEVLILLSVSSTSDMVTRVLV